MVTRVGASNARRFQIGGAEAAIRAVREWKARLFGNALLTAAVRAAAAVGATAVPLLAAETPVAAVRHAVAAVETSSRNVVKAAPRRAALLRYCS